MSPRRQRFVELLMPTDPRAPVPSAADAYVTAGFSPNGARANAARLIANDSVRAALQERLEHVRRRVDDTIERCLDQLRVWAFGDLGRVADWGFDPEQPDAPQVRLIPSDQLSLADASIVESIAQGRHGARIKRVNPLRAMGMLLDLAHWLHRIEPPAALDTAADVSTAVCDVVRGVYTGELPPAKVAPILRALEHKRKAIETDELEQRMTALEERIEPFK